MMITNQNQDLEVPSVENEVMDVCTSAETRKNRIGSGKIGKNEEASIL